jgi:hypothetical protein
VHPAGIESIVASAQLPLESAQPLRRQSAQIEFEVTASARDLGRTTALHEKSTFFVPR